MTASEAFHFLEAGGVLSLADWRELDEVQRANFVAARRRLDVIQAVRVGRCARSHMGEAVVLAEIDGGENIATANVANLVDQVAQAITGGG